MNCSVCGLEAVMGTGPATGATSGRCEKHRHERTVNQELVEALKEMLENYERDAKAVSTIGGSPNVQYALTLARAALDRAEAAPACFKCHRRGWTNTDALCPVCEGGAPTEKPVFSDMPHICTERNCTRSSVVRHV